MISLANSVVGVELWIGIIRESISLAINGPNIESSESICSQVDCRYNGEEQQFELSWIWIFVVASQVHKEKYTRRFEADTFASLLQHMTF